LIVRLRGASEQVTVRNHYAGAPIDAVAFADGTVWDRATIDAHITNELGDGPDIHARTAAIHSRRSTERQQATNRNRWRQAA
ncbi:calcium-binding protein, partial [Accumulibacter sp.]|uniref:calcium-binding protein n=1 Tax=Accumulibacter sp. TaxID=2053492 RepID=UPI001AC24DC6